MKLCKKCGETKPTSSFSRRALSADGLQHWCKICKAEVRSQDVEKARAYEAHWRSANPELVQDMQTRFLATRPNYRTQKSRAWASANPETNRAAKRKWARSNKAAIAAKEMRRWATKSQATPVWIDHAVVQSYYETAEALGMWTGEWYHVDHVVPLRSDRVCGLHVHTNLQVLTALENRIKSNRHWPDQP